MVISNDTHSVLAHRNLGNVSDPLGFVPEKFRGLDRLLNTSGIDLARITESGLRSTKVVLDHDGRPRRILRDPAPYYAGADGYRGGTAIGHYRS